MILNLINSNNTNPTMPLPTSSQQCHYNHQPGNATTIINLAMLLTASA